MPYEAEFIEYMILNHKRLSSVHNTVNKNTQSRLLSISIYIQAPASISDEGLSKERCRSRYLIAHPFEDLHHQKKHLRAMRDHMPVAQPWNMNLTSP
jgi:hypothetical protein